MAKITVSAVAGAKGVNYRKIQVDKIERVCGACGKRVPAEKPYGTIYVPVSLRDLDEITIKIRTGGEKDGGRD